MRFGKGLLLIIARMSDEKTNKENMILLKSCLTSIILGFVLSCSRPAQGPDARVLNSFTNFELVGKGPVKLDNDGAVDTTFVVDHDNTSQPNPDKLDIGTMYILHPRGEIDVESMALNVIPGNLSRLGFKIIEAPESSDDMLHLYLGGPIFHIRFSDGTHEGLIFDQNHGLFEDFILVYTR